MLKFFGKIVSLVLTCTFYYKLTLWITCAIQSLFFFISCQIGLRRNSQKKGVQKYFLGHFCKHFSVDIPWIPLLIFYQCSTRHCRIKNYSQIPRAVPRKRKKKGSPAYVTTTLVTKLCIFIGYKIKSMLPMKK